MLCSVDRITPHTVYLEDEEGRSLTITPDQLAPGVAEGDLIRQENDALWHTDPAATEARRARIRARLERLNRKEP